MNSPSQSKLPEDRKGSSTRRIKVGLLGAGYILTAHAKALSVVPGVEIRAVCDVSAGRAAQAAQAFGIPNVYRSLAELLESDCEVVHVLLPPFLHVDAARQLLEAGKSVFIEKPMGLRSSECQALVELAASRQLRMGVNHNFLFLPGYEQCRRDVADGAIGHIDHLTVNWLFSLGLIQSGPFDNWILDSEGNLPFELGSHVAAFVIDLLGPLDEVSAIASHPIEIPGGRRVYRHWNAIGRRDNTSVSWNLSAAPGQSDRSLRIRGSAATAQFAFDRDIYWREQTSSNSAIFDPLRIARSTARQISAQGLRNAGRYLLAILKRTPQVDAFQDSICRSVAAFYAGLDGDPDPRVDGRFGVEVIRLCESIVRSAEVEPAAPPKAVRVQDVPAPTRPTVLVVGGTGFIGRHLVKLLTERGIGVRVLSRSSAGARLALAGLPVDLVQGGHDDRAVLDRALDGIDVVYHLAKSDGRQWADYVRGDVEPTRVLAEAALAHGVKRFVYTGTIDSYFSAREQDVIDSDTPLDPRIGDRNLYARSKAACEAILQTMHHERGLPLVVFRPGVVIGEGSPPAHWGVGMFHSDARVQLWGEGTTKLPLVLVGDVAEALALGMTVPGIEGQTFLLTDEPLLSAKDYVDEVARASETRISAQATPIWKFFAHDIMKEAVKHLVQHPNRRVPHYRDWNCRAHRARYDSAKTRTVLGWRPAGTRDAMVSQGIVAAVRRYRR